MPIVRMRAACGDSCVYVNSDDVVGLKDQGEGHGADGGFWDTCTIALRGGHSVHVGVSIPQAAVLLGFEKAPPRQTPLQVLQHADGRVRYIGGTPTFWSTAEHHRDHDKFMLEQTARGWKAVST